MENNLLIEQHVTISASSSSHSVANFKEVTPELLISILNQHECCRIIMPLFPDQGKRIQEILEEYGFQPLFIKIDSNPNKLIIANMNLSSDSSSDNSSSDTDESDKVKRKRKRQKVDSKSSSN